MRRSIQDTINFIRSEKFDQLTLNELIDVIPTFGLNDESLNEFPNHLRDYYGHGIRLWQYPIQISPFLKWAQTLNVKSYMEIGVRWGGNFILVSEVLKRNNRDIQLFGCDVIEKSPGLNEYHNYSDFIYLQMESHSQEFKTFVNNNLVEFAYIDGNHFYHGCMGDYMLFRDNINTKYIVFHDIVNQTCPDTMRVWKEVKNDSRFDTLEFTEQYPRDYMSEKKNYMGIGVLIRK